MHSLIPIFTITLLVGFVSSCPQDCDCKHHVATCTCIETNDFHVISLEFDPSPSELIISDCNMVVLYQWIATGSARSLHKLHVQRVDRLLIKENFIMESNEIVSVSIEDCGQVNFEEMSFAHSQGIDRLTFTNVTIPYLPAHTFDKLDRIGSFVVANSTIGTVQPHAFGQIDDVYHFTVVNTVIRLLESNAFEMSTTRDFTFKNVTVESWSSGALALSNIDNLVLKKLHVEELQRNALIIVNVTNFTISHCHFDLLRFQAFGSLSGIQSLNIVNNTIRTAESGSLILPLQEILELKVESNLFYCTHRLCWLVEGRSDSDNAFVQTSTCFGPANMTGKSLSAFGLVGVDDEDMCGDVFSGDSDVVTTTSVDMRTFSTNFKTTDVVGDATTLEPKIIPKEQERKVANDVACQNESLVLVFMFVLCHVLHCMQLI